MYLPSINWGKAIASPQKCKIILCHNKGALLKDLLSAKGNDRVKLFGKLVLIVTGVFSH